MTPSMKYAPLSTTLVLTAIAAAALSACGGSDTTPTPTPPAPTVTMSGVVVATAFKPGSAADPTITSGYYQGASVCIDANNNGVCDASENPVTTDAKGAFTLTAGAVGPLLADIGTSATNTASGAKVASRLALRAVVAQVTEQGTAVVISPLSSDVARAMEANGSDYPTEKANLATRLGVATSAVLSDVNAVADAASKSAMQFEANALANRYTYATTKLDRKDLYPDALAVPGGDPTLKGLANVTAATAGSAADSRTAITFLQSQQAAFNIEGVPRYDHVFIVMLENKATSSILNSPFAPKINGYLQAGNQLTSYYATGNPSEPNYTAIGGADDFGITDDSQWNCDAAGANAVQDLPTPDASQPGLAKSPFTATCTQTAGVSHNIVGKPNLFVALNSVGLNWRTYSESMNPGQDARTDSVGDAAVTAQDNVYAAGTVGGNSATIGTTGLVLPLPAQLYRTKHHPGMAYENVRSAPEFKYSNRTMGGGQWDANLAKSTDYTIPANYDYDQFGTDLASGHVGAINFVVPDQCDDMHGITVNGTVAGATGTVLASDCAPVANNVANATGGAIITRGDNYVDKLVKKIQASPLWKNGQARRHRADVRRGQRHRRLQLLLRLESGQQHRRQSAQAKRRRQLVGRQIGQRLHLGQPRPRPVGVRHPDQPGRRADRHQGWRRLQPLLVQPHAAGHVPAGRPGRRQLVYEPLQVHREVHRRQHPQPARVRWQRRHPLRFRASGQPRLRGPGLVHAEAVGRRERAGASRSGQQPGQRLVAA